MSEAPSSPAPQDPASKDPAPQPSGSSGSETCMGCLILLGICALIGWGVDKCGGGSDATSTDTGTSIISSTSDSSSDSSNTITSGVGDVVKDGKFAFEVMSVSSGDPGCQCGPFITVHVNVMNIGKESQLFSPVNQYLYDASGSKYDSDASSSTPEFGEEINPGLVTSADLVYAIPPGTPLDHIELHDSMFSGGVEVNLQGQP